MHREKQLMPDGSWEKGCAGQVRQPHGDFATLTHYRMGKLGWKAEKSRR